MTQRVTTDKILSVDGLAECVKKYKANGKRVVMCHGVFDLVHIGHIRHFEEAKSHGDVLVVTLTPDRHVNKGPHRPTFTETLRAEGLAALGVIDHVAINEWSTAVETLLQVRPDIYCKGGEYRHAQIDAKQAMQPELEAARSIGTRVEFTDDIVFSSSEILNRHFNQFLPETESWLEKFRSSNTMDEVVNVVQGLRGMRPLVVGEAIIDEYVLCSTIGKSTKDPVLATKYISEESYLGGALAVANHLAGLCDQVGLITCLGDSERKEELIREQLRPNVNVSFVTKSGSPTIQKRRYVDEYHKSKLLELYRINDSPLVGEDEAALHKVLRNRIADYDLVIVPDFGHGFLCAPTIDLLCAAAPFLCVNTQSNAGNRGFNPISKYPKADYVSLASHEVHLETRMREAPLRELLGEVAKRITCPRFTATQGSKGSLHLDRENGRFYEVPAFATKVEDRVGAGDAFFAVTSLLSMAKVSWDVLGFVGNVAGAQVVAELGNRKSIDSVQLNKHIISLLK